MFTIYDLENCSVYFVDFFHAEVLSVCVVSGIESSSVMLLLCSIVHSAVLIHVLFHN